LYPRTKNFQKPIALENQPAIFPFPFRPVRADSLTRSADNRPPSGVGIDGSALQVADLVWENELIYASKDI